MGQIRYYDFGAPQDNETENTVRYALNQKGVYRGFDLSVDTDGNLVVGTGYALQHNGVAWQEDTDLTFAFNDPATATNYTLVATHEDRSMFGGVPVEYELRQGTILTNADLANGIVIGWIYHPGGGLPLLAEYLLKAPTLVDDDYARLVANSQPIELLPPIQRSAVTTVGLNLTFTPVDFDVANFVVMQKVENSPTAVPAVQQLIQNIGVYVNDNQRPQDITVYVNFASTPLTKITIEVYDTSQVAVPVTNGVITGSGAWTSHTATVDRTAGTFDNGKPYTVRITHDVNKGEYTQLARVAVGFWPYP